MRDFYIFAPMRIELPSDSPYELSEHFAQRWVERSPDDWDRFVWILHSGAHYVMCEDSSRKTHLLHYNPAIDQWFVFFYTHNYRTGKQILVSILYESMYVSVSNSAPIQYHKTPALDLLRRRHIVGTDTKSGGIVLHFKIETACACRVIEFLVPWAVCGLNDLYMYHVNKNTFIDRIIARDAFVEFVYAKYPVGVKIFAAWVTILGNPSIIEIELVED